jgi:hypothetical protein
MSTGDTCTWPLVEISVFVGPNALHCTAVERKGSEADGREGLRTEFESSKFGIDGRSGPFFDDEKENLSNAIDQQSTSAIEFRPRFICMFARTHDAISLSFSPALSRCATHSVARLVAVGYILSLSVSL